MTNRPTHLVLTVEVGQKLLDYLQQRPYVEVFGLIPLLINSEKLPADPPATPYPNAEPAPPAPESAPES